MRSQFKNRIRLVLAFVVFGALLILARLYFVQIVEGDEYSLKADRQFASGGSGLFDRGSIYFTRKDGTLISAATLSTGFLVAVNPQTLTDPGAAFSAIESVAPGAVAENDFLAAAAKKNLVYVEVAHHLSDAAGKALAAENIQGLQVLRERWRYYPGGALAASAIGIVSYGSGDALTGQTGLESVYDDTLSRSGDSLYKNFFAQLFSSVGDLLVNARDAREGDVITTIEPEVESRLTDDIAKVNQRYSSKESGGIIMDPATGAIVALATAPSYDANNLATVTDPAVLGDPLVEHVYEFGSIMKPLTMTSGLDSGAITATTTYDDTGCITVDTRRICNWDFKARGVIPMKEIIKQSLNVGASWVATELGPDRFRTYFTELFGQKTGVDLPSETGALLGNLKSPRQVEYDNMSFGQGIAVTPMQMIRALGAIANHGVMVEPHLASAIRLSSGLTRTLDWNTTTPIFSAAATRGTISMMDELDDEILYNGKAKIPTMSVAVKTGTAQLTKPGGGYYTDKYFHSFVGFFPSYNPRFIILLYTNDPKGVQYASETLDETFLDLTHFLIDYYAIPPDRGIATTTAL